MATMNRFVILGLVLVISVVANATSNDQDDPFINLKYDRRGLGQAAGGAAPAGGAAAAGGGGAVIDITKVGGKGDGVFDNTPVSINSLQCINFY